MAMTPYRKYLLSPKTHSIRWPISTGLQRNSRQRCSLKRFVLKHFGIFTGKHLPFMSATLLKGNRGGGCPVNTAKFLRILCSQNMSK